MKRARRFLISLSLILPAAEILGCGGGTDSLAPTPTSPLVGVAAIEKTNYVVSDGPTGWRMIIAFTLTNATDAPIYFNPACLLVLQRADGNRWVDAISSGCTPRSLDMLDRRNQAGFGLAFSGSRSVDLPKEGTYRIHVFLFFDQEGKQPLPADAGYSQPFPVRIDFSR